MSKVIEDIKGMFGKTATDAESGNSTEGTRSGDHDAENFAALAALKKGARKGRNRPADKLKDAAALADLEALYAPENMEVLSCLYFDLRYAWTGWEEFKLSDKQARILSTTMGAAARVLIRINPEYVALILFLGNFGAFAMAKETAYAAELKKRKGQAVAGSARGTTDGR